MAVGNTHIALGLTKGANATCGTNAASSALLIMSSMVKAMSCLILTEMCTYESVPPAVAGEYNVYDSTDNHNTTRPLPQAVLTYKAIVIPYFLSISPHGR